MAEHRFQQGNQYAKGHGRPKGSGRVQICETWADQKGFKKLIEIAESEDPGFRIHPKTGRVVRTGWSPELKFEAIKLILAYGKGKPTEFVDLTSGGASFYDFLRTNFSPATNGHANGNGHSSAGPA